MNRRNEPITAIEVLKPGEMEPQRRPTNMETLDALVRQRVAEILAARDDLIFEPWFRTRQVAYEIRRLQTVPERKRHVRHFERYGCTYCHKRDQPHGAIGFCTRCYARMLQEYKQIDLEFANERPEE